jgi:hypothetical protein
MGNIGGNNIINFKRHILDVSTFPNLIYACLQHASDKRRV